MQANKLGLPVYKLFIFVDEFLLHVPDGATFEMIDSDFCYRNQRTVSVACRQLSIAVGVVKIWTLATAVPQDKVILKALCHIFHVS